MILLQKHEFSYCGLKSKAVLSEDAVCIVVGTCFANRQRAKATNIFPKELSVDVSRVLTKSGHLWQT